MSTDTLTPRPARRNKTFMIILGVAAGLVLLCVCCNALLPISINGVSARVRVDGGSMLPTLKEGEYVLVNRLAYRSDLPGRGDIVVFRFPLDPAQLLMKRVIGLPGDHVAMRNGSLYLNDQAVTEGYVAATADYSGEWLVPQGSIFVLGDNRNDSSDSHSWGMLPLENLAGQAEAIYWPPSAWGRLPHADLAQGSP